MPTRCIVAGAVLGFLAVAAGAFGAHALKAQLSPGDLKIYETAVAYQMSHALALILYGLFARGQAVPAWPAIAFAAGVVIFSGSLYALVLTGARRWGMVTPIGGVAFLVGWAGFALVAWRTRA